MQFCGLWTRLQLEPIHLQLQHPLHPVAEFSFKVMFDSLDLISDLAMMPMQSKPFLALFP
jgi:hypothetical protein